MSDVSDPWRDAIHERIQELGSPEHDDKDKAAVLTGWVIVCEWMDEDGERWLSKAHAASLTDWSASGFHHEALFGDWPPRDDEDDE